MVQIGTWNSLDRLWHLFSSSVELHWWDLFIVFTVLLHYVHICFVWMVSHCRYFFFLTLPCDEIHVCIGKYLIIFNVCIIFYKVDVTYFIWPLIDILEAFKCLLLQIVLQCMSSHTCADISERWLLRNKAAGSEGMCLPEAQGLFLPVVYESTYLNVWHFFMSALHIINF